MRAGQDALDLVRRLAWLNAAPSTEHSNSGNRSLAENVNATWVNLILRRRPHGYGRYRRVIVMQISLTDRRAWP